MTSYFYHPITLMRPYAALRQIILVLLLALISNSSLAATAYATITANIVPWSSFALSNPIILSQTTSEKILSTQIDNQARISVRSSRNISYSISISSSGESINASGKKIALEHLQILNNKQQTNIESKLEIQAVVSDKAVNSEHRNRKNFNDEASVTLIVNFY